MTLTVDKMDGCGHINTACHERLPKKIKVTWYMVLAMKRLPKRWSASFIKVSGRMHSDTFKKRPAFSFTVTISA